MQSAVKSTLPVTNCDPVPQIRNIVFGKKLGSDSNLFIVEVRLRAKFFLLNRYKILIKMH